MATMAVNFDRRHPLRDYSLEMTAKEIDGLVEASSVIPARTQISVTSLPNETSAARLEAARVVHSLGFLPVPHISARRVGSIDELEAFLERLAADALTNRVFVVGGDLSEPIGPFEDAITVIRSGLLERYGMRQVGVAGHPEGHTAINRRQLDHALRDKLVEIEDRGMSAEITTQFVFDEAPLLSWLEELRKDGVTTPVRVGLPGPASLRTLLRFASRCGVEASAKVMTKYGLSLGKLLQSAGPDNLVSAFIRDLDPNVHGEVRFHIYPFGGFAKAAGWAHSYK